MRHVCPRPRYISTPYALPSSRALARRPASPAAAPSSSSNVAPHSATCSSARKSSTNENRRHVATAASRRSARSTAAGSSEVAVACAAEMACATNESVRESCASSACALVRVASSERVRAARRPP